jgi:hypothetical protein
MGSALCSQEWVANRLGKTTRTIRNYVKRGFLKQQLRDGDPVYDQDEVEQLAIEMGTDFPAMNRKSFIQMQLRIRKLEMDVTLIRRTMGIRNDPIRASLPDMGHLYKAATAALGAGKWTLEEVETWVEYFDKLDETAMVMVMEAAKVENPWDVFFRLCVNMQLQLVSGSEFSTNLKLQELHQRLDIGRRELRGVAIVWAELHPEQAPKGLLEALNNPYEEVKKRLARKGG